MWTLAREAQLHHDLGEYDDAERAFEDAEDRIVDTNPVPVAWLNVQRGLHEETRGEIDLAVTFFREAARRLPGYVAAEEHLAEALHMAGKDDEAVAIYRRVVNESSDPEYKGALAAILRARGEAKEADALKAQATAGYTALLAKYPEAMYWHASEYFLAEGGDPAKALALLRKNAVLRPNAGSFTALARAALAHGDDAEAKAAIDRAIATPVVSAMTFWTAARVAARTGDPGAAATYAAKARALDPRIEKEEPGIDPVARRD
jgi:tetratricopeptide (TPR) repeat protein